MSRRIRSIHPEFLDDEDLCRCSNGARLLAGAILVVCDDEGFARGAAAWVASQVWPYGGEGAAEVDGYLAELASIGYLIRYEVEGCKYLWVRNFKKYQHPQKPQKSRLPPVPDQYATGTIPVRDSSGTDWSGLDRSGLEGSGGSARSRGRTRRAPAKPAAPPPPTMSALSAFLTSTWPDVREPWAKEEDWAKAYPAVDLLAEARKARAWEMADPRRRKVKHERFLVSWWARQQDRGPTNGTSAPRPLRSPQVPKANPPEAFKDAEKRYRF